VLVNTRWVRSLFDTSTPESRRRTGLFLSLVVFGAMALGPWVLSPIILLLVAFPLARALLLETVDSGMREKNALLARVLIVAVPVAFYLLSSPPPPDDLLREMTAGLHDFDYRNLYWGSPRLMAGDTSYWYSRATGWLLDVLPKSEAYLPVQYALLAGWAITLPLVFRKALRLSHPNLRGDFLWLLAAAFSVVVWAFPGFMTRIVQARPENWGALIGTTAFLVSTDWGLWAWGAAMALFVPAYWLSFAYLPMALWMNIAWKKRLATAGALAAEFAVVWLSGLQGHWWHWFLGMPVAIAHRLVGVAENDPEWHLLQSGATWAVLFLALFALAGRRAPGLRELLSEKRMPAIVATLGLIVWFLLPDMVRYDDDLAPLLMVALIQAAPESRLRILDTPLLSALLLPALLFLVPSGLPKPEAAVLPDLHIAGAKPGQRVLSTLSAGEYFALYENPELRFAPACELGYTTKAVQRLGLGLASGKTTCAELRRYRVRWVLVKSISIAPNGLGRCLRLQRMSPDGYGIWSVAHG
jgi:hypothetical protein